MSEYKVKFEIFEGPLDLLLYLVKKEEVDIHQVNLTKIATQFIEYIELMREFDLEVAGEFLVMASTLVYIKSRELLPVEQQAVAEGEEEEEDPRWELIRRLVEYKKFKDAAVQLQERESAQEDIYPRLPGKPEFTSESRAPRAAVSVFDLVNAVNVILKRFTAQEARDVYEDKWTVGEKIESIRALVQTRAQVKFSDLFAAATSRGEVVVTFLAMLELIRLGQLVIEQPEPFAEIEIRPAPPESPAETAPPEPVSSAMENVAPTP
ncbi:MAG: chromosome segregation protein ScpA [Pedosphaera sp.]|nr:chromosome segregation protein ScpA [Pedosphaera sp.]MST00463.1 chromosome segregation protein ScpA [Pedosphaera sp.]